MAAAIPLVTDEQQTWTTFQDMLLKLTTSLGELNNDQYYRVLDVAAHLTSGVSGAPYIGGNGNWFIGNTDTGVSAQPPYIGANKNWWVGSTDTGVPATGPQGPPGAQGVPGSGLKILGTYSSLSGLQSAHPTGNPGDAYLVGSGGSYNLYIWDTGTNAWVTGGPLTAGIPDAPAGSPQPYVRNGQTVAWEPLSNYITGGGSGAYLPLTGGTLTGDLTIDAYTWPQLNVQGSTPNQNVVQMTIGQWTLESLYSAGSFLVYGPGSANFQLSAGLFQTTQIQTTSAGINSFGGPVQTGAGATNPSATSSWAGTLFFNTGSNTMQLFDGTVWRTIQTTVSPTSAINYVGGTFTNQAGAATITVNYPAGKAAGQVAYCFIQNNTASPTVTATGWTSLGFKYANPPGTGTAIMRRVLDGTEGASVTFTTTTGNTYFAQMRLYSGVNTSTPEDAASGNPAWSGNNTGQPSTPTFTTVTNGAWIVAYAYDYDALETLTTPTNFLHASLDNANSNGCSQGSWDMMQFNAGPVGTITSGGIVSGHRWNMTVIALRSQ